MKTIALIVSTFICITRLAAAVIIDLGSVQALNDTASINQLVLERVNKGQVSSACTFANGGQSETVQFKVVPPQRSYTGLAGTVPSFEFTTVDVDDHIVAELWGDFYIDDERVYNFGGSIQPTPVKGGDLAADVNGWITFLPFTITVDGIADIDIYTRMPWGSSRRMDKERGNTFRFDPSLSGTLGLAVFTYGGGRVTGYDFGKRKFVTSREVWVYLNSFQGDVDFSTVGPGNPGPQREIFYWADEGGEAYGTVPIYELTVNRTGKVNFDLNLKTYSGQHGNYGQPTITGFDAYLFNEATQKWVVIPALPSEKGDYQHRGTTFDAPVNGIYRVVPRIENLKNPPYSEGKG